MTPATIPEPETPSNTGPSIPSIPSKPSTRIDGTSPICVIAHRVEGVYKGCSNKCGQPLTSKDYDFATKNWECYRNCGLPKLGYEPTQAGEDEASLQLTTSPYWTGLNDRFSADRRAMGGWAEADMGKSAAEFFEETCIEEEYDG